MNQFYNSYWFGYLSTLKWLTFGIGRKKEGVLYYTLIPVPPKKEMRDTLSLFNKVSALQFAFNKKLLQGIQCE